MIRQLTVNDIQLIAHTLAQELMSWNEPIPPFETRYTERLESCINAVYQSFDGKDLYPTLLDKAAALFYFMIKSHPFQNGNKRVAVTALLVLLFRNGQWIQIDEQGLYNFAVWVAKSPPNLKESVIGAVMNFLEKTVVDK